MALNNTLFVQVIKETIQSYGMLPGQVVFSDGLPSIEILWGDTLRKVGAVFVDPSWAHAGSVAAATMAIKAAVKEAITASLKEPGVSA